MTTLRRINQDDLRNHNLSVVISTLLRAAEPMSRAELAKQTGLTKATMSLLVSMTCRQRRRARGDAERTILLWAPQHAVCSSYGGRYCGHTVCR